MKEALERLLAGKLSALGASLVRSGGDPCLEVPAACLKEAAQVLKNDPGTAMDFLACLSGVDLLPSEPRFELVYHLRSLAKGHRMVLKTRAGGPAPSFPSLTGVWGAADWFERETFDLLGVAFEGHPDLRRILMPPAWSGHPLRKDYPLEGPARADEET